MNTNRKSKLTYSALIKFIFFIALTTLSGCGGSNSEENEEISSAIGKTEEVLDLTGSWLSSCGQRDDLAHYANELVFTSDSLEIIQHQYDTADCSGSAVKSISQVNKSYTYPESNSDINDKFIVVELFQDPYYSMNIYVEIYDDLLYLSDKLSITYEGYTFDSSQTSDINYANYLTKKK